MFILPEVQEKVWKLKLKGFREVEIAQQLNVSRQAVNKAIRAVKSKLAELFVGLSKVLDCDIIKLDIEKGLFVGRGRQIRDTIYGCYVPGHGPILVFSSVLDLKDISVSANVQVLLSFAREYFDIDIKEVDKKALKKVLCEVFERL